MALPIVCANCLGCMECGSIDCGWLFICDEHECALDEMTFSGRVNYLLEQDRIARRLAVYVG